MSQAAVVKGSGWDDYITSGLAIGDKPSLNPPAFNTFRDGFKRYQYSNGDEGNFDIHILHNYKAGSKVYPHIHWAMNVAGATGSGFWRVYYSPAKGYSQQAFPAEASFDIPITPEGTQYMHQIDEATEAQAFNTNLEVDSIVMGRVELVAGTLSHDPFLIEVDFHIESDGRLTNEMNAPFTKRRS